MVFSGPKHFKICVCLILLHIPTHLNSTSLQDGKYSLGPFAWLKVSVIDDEPLDAQVNFIGFTTPYDPAIPGLYTDADQNPIVIHWPANTAFILNLNHMVSFLESAIYSLDTAIYVNAYDTLNFVYHY